MYVSSIPVIYLNAIYFLYSYYVTKGYIFNQVVYIHMCIYTLKFDFGV